MPRCLCVVRRYDKRKRVDVAARDYEEQEPRPKFFRQSPAESESPQTLQFTDPEREQEQPAEDGCAESRGLGNDRLTGGTDAGDASARFCDSAEAASAGQGVESSEDSQPENSNDAHDVSEKDTATSQRWAPAEEDGSADRASRQAAPWEDSEFGACFGKSGGHYAWTESGASRVRGCGSPSASVAEQVPLSIRAGHQTSNSSSFFTSSPFSFPTLWTVAPTDSRRRRSPEKDFAHHARVETTERTAEKDFLRTRVQTTTVRNAEKDFLHDRVQTTPDRNAEKDFLHDRVQTTPDRNAGKDFLHDRVQTTPDRNAEKDFLYARQQTTPDTNADKDFLYARHHTTERNAEEKSSFSEPCFRASALRDSPDAGGDKDSDAGRSDAGAWVPVYGAAGGGVSRALRCRGESAGAARVETAAEEEDERQWEDVVQEEEGSGRPETSAVALPPSTLPRQSLKEEGVTKSLSTDKTVFHQNSRFPAGNVSPHTLCHRHPLTSLATSVIKCSGFSLAQPIIKGGDNGGPQSEDSRVCFKPEQQTSYIKLSKDYVKLPRELFFQRAEEQPSALKNAAASPPKTEGGTNPQSTSGCLSSSQSGRNVRFFKDEPADERADSFRKAEMISAVSAGSFVGKTEPRNSSYPDHWSQTNIGVYRPTSVPDSYNNDNTDKNDQLIPSPVPNSTCSNRPQESIYSSYVSAATPTEREFLYRSKLSEKDFDWPRHPSCCSLSMFPPAPTFRLKPALVPPAQLPGLASFPVNFPPHPAYPTGIPENLSPPPALSVTTKFGSMPTSPLTSPKHIRPLTLGYGVTHYDRDDDARSTSSASSSMSSGSLPSPRRAERVSSHADVARGYSTSTPSPMTSPLSQLSPASPGVTSVELVNGGYGFKNPILTQPVSAQQDGQAGTGAQTQEGDYRCQVCDKRFRLQRHLTRHLKCHSEVKRFLCSICRKGFNDTFDLKRHTRTHTGVKPFKCHCGKAFTQRCSLESHERKVHGESLPFGYKERRAKLYVCEDCGCTSQDPAEHFLHIQSRHPHSPVLLKFYDKRQFKFSDGSVAKMLHSKLGSSSLPMRAGFRKN